MSSNRKSKNGRVSNGATRSGNATRKPPTQNNVRQSAGFVVKQTTNSVPAARNHSVLVSGMQPKVIEIPPRPAFDVVSLAGESSKRYLVRIAPASSEDTYQPFPGTADQLVQINRMFPVAADEIALYTEYRLCSLKAHFTTFTSTLADGAVRVGYTQDPSAEVPDSFTDMSQLPWHDTFVMRTSKTWELPIEKKWLYTRTSRASNSELNVRFTDNGYFTLTVSDADQGSIGQLSFSAVIEVTGRRSLNISRTFSNDNCSMYQSDSVIRPPTAGLLPIGARPSTTSDDLQFNPLQIAPVVPGSTSGYSQGVVVPRGAYQATYTGRIVDTGGAPSGVIQMMLDGSPIAQTSWPAASPPEPGDTWSLSCIFTVDNLNSVVNFATDLLSSQVVDTALALIAL